jgi:hypothetical protein
MGRGVIRSCLAWAVVPAFALGPVAAAQISPQILARDTVRYQRIAPIDQYLMADQAAEIALARSAAPDTISRGAEILVLGPHGYRSAVKGTNGFVCIVERSWMSPFDDPMFLNPAQRLPLCLNPPAARTHLPFTIKATTLAFAGLSKAQMFDSITVAYKTHSLPLPEAGSMCYMLSKEQYFGSEHGHADPHLMFWFPQSVAMQWGAREDGPVYVHQNSPDPITTFVISVGKWSDGTAAPAE